MIAYSCIFVSARSVFPGSGTIIMVSESFKDESNILDQIYNKQIQNFDHDDLNFFVMISENEYLHKSRTQIQCFSLIQSFNCRKKSQFLVVGPLTGEGGGWGGPLRKKYLFFNVFFFSFQPFKKNIFCLRRNMCVLCCRSANSQYSTSFLKYLPK